jgi:2-phosphoglycerate kinase
MMSQPRRLNPFPLGDANLPYSKGLMARALIAIGVSGVRAYELARRVEVDLATRDERVVELDRLQELATDVLGPIEGREAVRRLRRYNDLEQLDLPIILLLGGATGTGKSTVATEAGYRLGITRLTSTHFIRQTMRAFFSEEFMPTIHHASFEAWRGLPEPEQEEGDPVLRGFLQQTKNVLVGVRASIERALEEGWSMVLEGVHIVPGMVPPEIDGALVVQCVLGVEQEEVHAANFFVRDAATDGVRPVEKYLDGLDDIRLIQDFIVRQARKHSVPVIDNGNIDRTVGRVIELVMEGSERLQRVP